MSARRFGSSVGETVAETIAREMATRGFEPTSNYTAGYVEYGKTYADSQGRIARAVVQFTRPSTAGSVRAAADVVSSEPVLAGFNVLVQAHVDPTSEAVLERAPAVVQADLLGVVAAFEPGHRPAQSLFARCGTCATPVSEYFVEAAQVRCRSCAKR